MSGAASPAPPPLRVLLVGHSHLRCIREAAEGAAVPLRAQGLAVDCLSLHAPRFEPAFTPATADGSAPATLSPVLAAALQKAAAGTDGVCLAIGGNAHEAFGLVEHPTPFDFVCETEPQAPLLPGREPVTGGLIAAALEATPLYARQRALRQLLAAALPGPLAELESPPPNAAAHLMQHAGVYADRLREGGLAPTALRRKLWRLHSRLVRRDGEAAGIGFIPVPEAAIGADGCLVAAARAPDATHANAWYGRRVIEQLAARLGRPFHFPEDRRSRTPRAAA